MGDTTPQTAEGKVLLHFAMSLDGFVAGPQDGMDWMSGGSVRPGLHQEYITTTGAILGGRKGWDQAIDGSRPYGGAWAGPIFVLTHHPEDATPGEGVTFLSCDPAEAVRIGLVAAGGKNLEVFSPTIGRQLLELGLIDGARILEVNGVDLCVDAAGDAADPAILLISGMGGSMDWWEEEFRQRLAAGGRFVIRYDHRDTGRSVSYPAGAPGYTGADLAADVVGVLDALGRRSAHLAGISMGGALAQQVALAHPDRVDSLVLMSTSPAVPGALGRSELPPMSEDLRAYFAAEVPRPDWAERTAVIDYLVGYERRLEAAEYFDEAHVRALVEQIVDRTNDVAASMMNHALAEEGELARGRLDEIAAPTLVIHGTADPMFPYGHAEALARGIPRAELLPLEGVGHQVPPRPWWPSVIAAMLRHTSGLRRAPSALISGGRANRGAVAAVLPRVCRGGLTPA